MSDDGSNGRDKQEVLQRFADTRRQESEETETIDPASKYLQRSAIYISILCLGVGLIAISLGRLNVIVTARGAIEPRTKLVAIQSRNVGVVRDVAVNFGETVQQGQVLMTLRTESSDAEIAALARQLDLTVDDKDRKIAEVKILESVVADFSSINQEGFDLSKADSSVELLQAVRIASLAYNRAQRLAGPDLDQLRLQTAARIEAINKTVSIRQENLQIADEAMNGLAESQNLRRQQLTTVQDLLKRGVTTKTRELEVSDQVLARVSNVNDQREKIGELKLSIANDELRIADLNLEIRTETRKRQDAFYEAERTLAGSRATVIAHFAKLKTDINTLGADIERRRADLFLRKERAKQLEIRAPVSGSIASLAASPGIRVEDGTEVASLVPYGVTNVVTVNLPSRDVGEIRTGQHAIVKLDAFPFYRFGTIPAHVTAIFPRPGSKLFGVRLDLDKPTITLAGKEENIAVGLETTVEIITDRRPIIGILFDRGARIFSRMPVDKTPDIDGPETPAKPATASAQ